MKLFALALPLLIATPCQANDPAPEPNYAVTHLKSAEGRGTTHATHVVLLGGAQRAAKCRAAHEAMRKNSRNLVEKQECLVALPPEIAQAEDGAPLKGAYVAHYERMFLLWPLQNMLVIRYEFDPGPVEAVCERITEPLRKYDPKVKCVPPR